MGSSFIGMAASTIFAFGLAMKANDVGLVTEFA